MRLVSLTALSLAVLALGAASQGYAETGYSANLTGLQEVPPNASPGLGQATVVLNNTQDMIHVHLEFSGLLAAQTAAHLHGPAGVGVNAAAQITLPVGNPVDVDLAITPAQVTMLQGGLMYINVHTTFAPGGEIRGQLSADPTPTEPATWGRIKSLFE